MLKKETFLISGMQCSGCSGSLKRALLQSDSVQEVIADHETGTAEVHHSLSYKEISEIVERAGFHVTGTRK